MSGLILSLAIIWFVVPSLQRIAAAQEAQARAWQALAKLAERGRR